MPVIYNKKVEYAYTDPGVKAHTLSWAEYQALSEDDKMNGDLYFIPDKQPEGNPSRIWTKLGTDPLTTQADDVSGAVNELNSSLNALKTKKTISGTTDTNGLLIPSTPISANSNMIISAYVGGSYIVIPFVAASNNSWVFKVLYSNMSQAASQNVTITYLAVKI